MIQNPELYQKAREIADATYDKPSAYKSSFLVKKYKEMGGTYSGPKTKKGLTRWHEEQWMDIGNKEYPVYRPTKRISRDTPLTVQEIDPQNLKEQIALKQRIRKKNLPRFEHKISRTVMPKHGKGKHGKGMHGEGMHGAGFLDDLKDFGVSAAKDLGREIIPIAKDYAISAAKSALKAKTGTGLFAENRGRGYYSLSTAQARSLRAGRGIQLKPSMMGGDYELEMSPMMQKKLDRSFAKGKGMRVSSQNLIGVKKGGFVVPLLMTAARIAAPIIIEKLAEAGIKKLGGGVGKSKPKVEKEVEKILEKAKRKKTVREEAPRQHGQVTEDDKAIIASISGKGPMKHGLFGLDMGSKILGEGLFAGNGVIQTGSPYMSIDSPAFHPFIPKRNPFGQYCPL